MDNDNIDSQTAAAPDAQASTWQNIKSVISALAFIGFVLMTFTYVVILFSKGFAEAWPGAAYAALCLAISVAAAWPIEFSKPEAPTDKVKPTEPSEPLGPQLPTKGSGGQYYGDRPIVERINEAIDLAAAGEWDAVEIKLRHAKVEIDDFEPYDNSDVYLPGIWEGDIEDVREYCAQVKEIEGDQG